MNLLALDTSTEACSVALQTGDVVHDRHELRPREHTRLLLPMINDVLAAGGVAVDELDAVVLGNGPGSFIGLRIAASVAQGLCYGSGAALVPVSSLAAVAVEVFALHRTDTVLVAQDAHMNEVYLAVFTAGSDRLPCDEGTVRLQRAGRIDTVPDGAVAAGAGWHRLSRPLGSESRPAGRIAGTAVPSSHLPPAARPPGAGSRSICGTCVAGTCLYSS
ncbi:MAG: tRNA (adenosine(37)-N6)-threonylcarbamoyltransferase complex dimerization subunit type 1 TsaB [Woeseiaceae bacterium]|nr:tRNA (adenosine(37)-N6)-threonylcarbamoyltransferase complex dimerization subunit type 1 TsaB [Woeseiaceae bacterium]